MELANELSENLKPIRLDDVLEPYRNAFIIGDIQQQNIIINNFVSSLVTAEISRLTEERRSYEEDVKASPLQVIFTCSFCRELFHLPVTLVCGHTFCLECLTNYQRQGSTICSECGEESALCYTPDTVLRELFRLWFPKTSNVRNCIATANELLCQGRMEEFMESTKNLMTKYPHNVDVLNLVANGNKTMKNYNDALKYLDHACRLAPFCSKIFHARGEVLASRGSSEEAMIMFLRALALKQNDPSYYCSLISCLEKQLRNACYPSTPLPFSSNLIYNAENDLDSAVKEAVNILPMKSSLNIEEPIAKNTPRARQVSNETQITSREIQTNDHKNEPTKAFVNVDNSCIRIEEAESDNCIQENTMFSVNSNILRELECNLCFNLIYDPVTTPCGHTLCRSCLRRSLDYRFDCPSCRADLQSYLEHIITRNIGTSKVLEKILLLKFNHDYQERRISHETELFLFSR